MRYSRSFTLATMSILLASAASSAQQRIDRRYAASPAASLRLTVLTQQSTIRVIGWDRDSVAITGMLAPGDRFDGGFTSTGSGGKFYVERRLEAPGAAGPKLEVRLPAGARLWVKASTADVDVSGVTGGLDLNIVGGLIRVSGRPRELSAEAMDGDIEVAERVTWLRAKTAGGAITIRGGGDDVGLTSVSGRVRVLGGAFTRARVETVTGDIEFEGEVERQGSLTFDSHSGAVVLRVPPALAATFEVTTISGEITNELTTARPAFASERRARELGITTGGGGAVITVRTFKGPVALRRR
ncbi:MAG: DUF4097 domain-containing protein [Gemmatimonadota bacterium]|nr:DUF4097 domain-containing protein [Gemmatimonadota bacterium]